MRKQREKPLLHFASSFLVVDREMRTNHLEEIKLEGWCPLGSRSSTVMTALELVGVLRSGEQLPYRRSWRSALQKVTSDLV